MARSRSSTEPNNPADAYARHAEEARAAMTAARSDAATTHFDHAAVAHDTAARMVRHAAICHRNASVLRTNAASAAARGRFRGPRPDLAAHFTIQADQFVRNAEYALQRAEVHHAKGIEHSAAAREIEAEEPDDAARVDAATEAVHAVDSADEQFMTAARRRE